MPKATDNPTTRRPRLVVVTDEMAARSAAIRDAMEASETDPLDFLEKLRELTRILAAQRAAKAVPLRRDLRAAGVLSLADYRGARP